MRNVDILAMRGGHRIISDTTDYTTYNFYGFIPHEDTTLTTLDTGDSGNIARTGETYKAGIYYGCPEGEGPGYYNQIELASGSVVLVLTKDSPSKY